MRTSPSRHYGRALICRAVLLMIAAILHAEDGSAAEAFGVPWSSLTLQAVRLGSTATAEVEIETFASAAEVPKFIDSPRGSPLKASGAEVHKLSVVTTVDILGGQRIRLENRLWFDPYTNTPLYLERTRLGLKDYYQRFRFTREGVFRQQREPAFAKEVGGPPESWTKLGQHFYPFPSVRPACTPVFETSMLILLVRELTVTHDDSTGPLCVFHKRQVHRVNVHPQPAQMVSYDYLEKRVGQEKRRVGTATAPGIFIASHPIGTYRGNVEDFLRNGSQAYLIPDDQAPLAVSGELPLIGRVEMKLKEIQLR